MEKNSWGRWDSAVIMLDDGFLFHSALLCSALLEFTHLSSPAWFQNISSWHPVLAEGVMFLSHFFSYLSIFSLPFLPLYFFIQTSTDPDFCSFMYVVMLLQKKAFRIYRQRTIIEDDGKVEHFMLTEFIYYYFLLFLLQVLGHPSNICSCFVWILSISLIPFIFQQSHAFSS